MRYSLFYRFRDTTGTRADSADCGVLQKLRIADTMVGSRFTPATILLFELEQLEQLELGSSG
jgi:hypothetical protein